MSQTKTKSNVIMVQRFTKQVIVSHWFNVIAFVGLYISGLPMYTDTFNFLYSAFGGPENARLGHRIFGVMFILPTVYMLIRDPKSFFHWIKQCFTWGKKDLGFLKAFPKEFLVGNAKYPKQDFYNAGEKINSFLQIITTMLLIASGIIMWFASNFNAGLVRWAFPIHSIGFALAIAVVVGHIFLSVLHPNSRPAWGGITNGKVPLEYAKEHHGVWYDELIQQEDIKKQLEAQKQLEKKEKRA